MLWLLVCLVGLTTETWVIIVLGRQVTSRYEGEEQRVVPVLVARPRRDEPPPLTARDAA